VSGPTATGLNEPLTFATVPALLRRAGEWVSAGRLDLSGVPRIDSAGLAFLLELAGRAKQQGHSLQLDAATPQIKELARFFGVDRLLQLDGQ
jgi:ABC-type transporter Mla MlaB component